MHIQNTNRPNYIHINIYFTVKLLKIATLLNDNFYAKIWKSFSCFACLKRSSIDIPTVQT